MKDAQIKLNNVTVAISLISFLMACKISLSKRNAAVTCDDGDTTSSTEECQSRSNESAVKLKSNECIDPDLNNVAKGVKLTLCNGSLGEGAFVTPDLSGLSAENVKWGVSVGGITGAYGEGPIPLPRRSRWESPLVPLGRIIPVQNATSSCVKTVLAMPVPRGPCMMMVRRMETIRSMICRALMRVGLLAQIDPIAMRQIFLMSVTSSFLMTRNEKRHPRFLMRIAMVIQTRALAQSLGQKYFRII